MGNAAVDPQGPVDVDHPVNQDACASRQADLTQPIDPRIAQVVPAEEWKARLTELNDVLSRIGPCQWKNPKTIGAFFIGVVVYITLMSAMYVEPGTCAELNGAVTRECDSCDAKEG